MPEFNLLKTVPNARRDVNLRLKDKEANRLEAIKFGAAYFDGPREHGYGGYRYDGRWLKVAETACARYKLAAGQRVLDIGCAKGFFVHDLMQVIPGLEALGLDISEYALTHCHAEVGARLSLGSADALPFEDASFDAVFSINTVHNLEREGCIQALKEMTRVCKRPENCFVQVDAYRTAAELALFEDWMLTAKTYCTPDEWLKLFAEAGYRGDYFWTILEFNDTAE